MSIGYNLAILVGNVGHDPKVSTYSNGTKIVARFTLATGESYKDKATGEKKDLTEWHSIVVFNEGLAKVVQDYVQKGTKLLVHGTIKTRKYQDKTTNEDKYKTEIVLNGFESKLMLLGDPKENNNNNNEKSASKDNSTLPPNDPYIDDNIPF